MQSCDLIIVALRDYLEFPMPNDARKIWHANIKHMFAIAIFANSSAVSNPGWSI